MLLLLHIIFFLSDLRLETSLVFYSGRFIALIFRFWSMLYFELICPYRTKFELRITFVHRHLIVPAPFVKSAYTLFKTLHLQHFQNVVDHVRSISKPFCSIHVCLFLFHSNSVMIYSSLIPSPGIR